MFVNVKVLVQIITKPQQQQKLFRFTISYKQKNLKHAKFN